jgi:hypothetical protein
VDRDPPVTRGADRDILGGVSSKQGRPTDALAAPARPVAALLPALLAPAAVLGCLGGPDFDGTRYRCVELVCPRGFDCVDAVCVPDPEGPGGGFTLVDDEQGEFEEGSFAATGWSGSGVSLVDGATGGEFRSRVFDGRRPEVAWEIIAWTPAAPYAKPLPGDGAREVGYREGAADMTGNLLLLHLDDVGFFGVALDSSGRMNDGELVAPDSLPDVAGVFGRSAALADGARVEVDLGRDASFDFGSGDFTWAFWVQTTEGCADERVHAAARTGSAEGPEVRIACAAVGSGCAAAADGVAFARVADGGAGSAELCGTSRLNDGRWRHLALVKRGHQSATVELHVDGAVEVEEEVSFAAGFAFGAGSQLALGALPGGGSPARVHVDEVALWQRALAREEIAALYRRGAVRLSAQTRTCATADCAGDPTFFPEPALVEPDDLLGPPASQFIGAQGRYLQYRFLFETAPDLPGPLLERVAVSGRR